MEDEDKKYYWQELGATSVALMGPDAYELVALVYPDMELDSNSKMEYTGPWRCISNEYTRLNFCANNGTLEDVKRLAVRFFHTELQFRAKGAMEDLNEVAWLLKEEYGKVEEKCGNLTII